MLEDDELYGVLRHLFSMCICGPSQSGKTNIIFQILRNKNSFIDTEINTVWYVYEIMQDKFLEIKKILPFINFVENLPDDVNLSNDLVIRDDMMCEVSEGKNTFFTQFITRQVHHQTISTIYTTQNLYSKKHRSISLSTNSIVFFNRIRDKRTIGILSRQMFPSNPCFLIEALVNVYIKNQEATFL